MSLKLASYAPSTKRVLIIEDYADSAQILFIALQSAGHTPLIAASGGEGLDKARGFRPDVVICDLGLPDMDGLSVARAIRADPELEHTWLIALTAYYLPAQAAAAGFDEYYTKPADVQRLASLLLHEPPPRASEQRDGMRRKRE